MVQYFKMLFNILPFTFLLLQKSNKKGAPKSITSLPIAIGIGGSPD
jgi:hypothetical protein